MDQQTWNKLTPAEKDKVRDLSGLIPELVGMEGWRIEVTYPDGGKARYYVGRSAGWIPCHLEIKTSRSSGGGSVYWPEGTTFRHLYKRNR